VGSLNFFQGTYVFIDNRLNMVCLIADRQNDRDELAFSHGQKFPAIENDTTQPCACPCYWSKFSQQKTKLCIYEGLEILHYRSLICNLEKTSIIISAFSAFPAFSASAQDPLHHPDAYNAW
jgi:hypothetical protein